MRRGGEELDGVGGIDSPGDGFGGERGGITEYGGSEDDVLEGEEGDGDGVEVPDIMEDELEGVGGGVDGVGSGEIGAVTGGGGDGDGDIRDRGGVEPDGAGELKWGGGREKSGGGGWVDSPVNLVEGDGER